MPVEIAHVSAEAVMAFVRRTEREALKTFYDFSVIWHEQRHDFAALDAEETVGVVEIGIAASLAHVRRVVVEPGRRLQGIGRALLQAAADTANYHNCHKMTVLVPHNSRAQTFFEHCGYRQEAVLAQHTFKLDMAVLRRFLL
ncbi:MAG TPA: GNAT family N-acetyltransferase [Candidatus Baltobacteraceae bacterium]|nr:GNAT family N-acetyltransferase [Candidatus Baltobacteraceae bacterium]